MPREKSSAEPQPATSNKDTAMFEPIQGMLAAADGERIAWDTEYSGLSGSESDTFGQQYLSTRSEALGEWSTEATVPPQSPETGLACPEYPGMVGWSSDFTKGVLADGASQEFGESGGTKLETFTNTSFGCGHAEPALRETGGAEIKEPAGFQDLFLHDNETGFYRLVNVTPANAPTPRPTKSFQTYFESNFLAGSGHLEDVAFEDELPLTEEAEKLSPAVEAACKEVPKGRACWEQHDDLYVWSEMQQPNVRLVTVLPDGNPLEGRLAGATRNLGLEPLNLADYRHAISADGSRIFFEAEGKLYVRENAYAGQSKLDKAHETAVNGEECAEPEKACTIQLDLPEKGSVGPSGAGKWLGSNAEGTKVFFADENDLTSTAVAGSGVNLYEYDLSGETDKPGKLVDLTLGVKAEVVGMSGMSSDGSYIYFVAKGKLTGNDKVAGRKPEESEPTAGEYNLYVSHEGDIRFIATLNEKDECDWIADMGCSSYGSSIVLGESGLTTRVSVNGRYLAFNSINQLKSYDNEASPEIYLYESESNYLACVSCMPNGAPPSSGGAVIGWPTKVARRKDLRNAYPQRNVSESGQVFFETSEALLPQQDTNGLRDVYEYEHGTLHLISSGTSAVPSHFLDASASGSDVFFTTAQKLLPRQTDSAYDIYDARVEGGFPEPAAPPLPCEGECKGQTGAVAVFSAPSSAMFLGLGNISQAKTLAKPKAKKKKTRKKNRRLGAKKAARRRHKAKGVRRRWT